MTRFGNLALASVASVAMLAAAPAQAADYLFDQNGDSFNLAFNGFVGDSSSVIPGLTSQLLLTLTGGVGTNTLNFSYTLTNTSTVGGPDSRVSGFAFDATPDVTGGSASGDFAVINYGQGNPAPGYPNGIGGVEVCLTNNGLACQGGGSGGAKLGDPASGTFSLSFGSITSAVTLNDFYVRYQSLNDFGGSASGAETLVVNPNVGGVPEPATWGMLLIGFGAIGATLRTRKSSTARRLRVA